ncbi:ABC transporter substrate-binding protein [Roseomonas sp. CECT 9278]|uniref:ABC transporter substrate-binding protein n=1 Tax=Roseomonas sp. CECT 9278 TaxID=2845823 RepID=UPI001E45A805|nr:ABC transporter substrate-binding protein [Roseomonas sp. CECT 9278]CAH0192607.1 Heme-binding protein A [Roseomonas sp. CECT 9278]
MVLTLALERVEFLPLGRVTDDTSILTLRSLVFEPLCRWRDGRVEPGLLAAWAHEQGGRAWQFALRPGATFHDGEACTADDVAETIAAHLRGIDMFGMPWPYARYLANARITPEGPGMLSISTPEPLADLPEILAEFFVMRAASDGAMTLGTGPYRVLDHAPRSHALLEAVDRDRAPARIRLVAEPDPQGRHRMVVEGTADAAANLERLPDLRLRDAALRWGHAANTLSVMYYLECRRGAFVHPAARRAVNLAVDVPAIIETLFQGLGVPASTIVSPFHLGHREAALSPIPHDPAAARALFDQAGATGELVIRTPLHMPERAPQISEMIAQDLARAGIPARIQTETDRPDYARQVGRGQIGDLAIFDSSPHSTFRVLNDKISSAVQGQWWQGFDDPALEPMITQANRTMDIEARALAYARCLRRLHDNPPWLYLFHPVEAFAARPDAPPLALDHRGVLMLV